MKRPKPKRLRIESYPPLKFKITPYSIISDDIFDIIRVVCELHAKKLPLDDWNKLVDKLYEEIMLILTEDIDFEA